MRLNPLDLDELDQGSDEVESPSLGGEEVAKVENPIHYGTPAVEGLEVLAIVSSNLGKMWL